MYAGSTEESEWLFWSGFWFWLAMENPVRFRFGVSQCLWGAMRTALKCNNNNHPPTHLQTLTQRVRKCVAGRSVYWMLRDHPRLMSPTRSQQRARARDSENRLLLSRLSFFSVLTFLIITWHTLEGVVLREVGNIFFLSWCVSHFFGWVFFFWNSVVRGTKKDNTVGKCSVRSSLLPF